MTTHALDPDVLIALNRMVVVGRSVAGMTHDVNNALQIIGGSVDLLGRGTSADDAGPRAAQRIRAQTQRAAEALSLLTEFARAADETPGPVSLRQIAVQALSMRSHALRRARLAVSFEAAAAPPAMVKGERIPLLQIALNLLMNAEQAMRNRSGPAIAIQVSESPGHATLQVTDCGGGVREDIRPRLFTPFETDQHPPDGPGLGLAVSRLLARRHGGDLTIETDGHGTVALLTLPAL